jgi:hypothetical protein
MMLAFAPPPVCGSVPRWDELPLETRRDVVEAALDNLDDRRDRVEMKLCLLDKRIHPQARHLEAYRRENRRLTEKLERIDRAIAAVKRLP